MSDLRFSDCRKFYGKKNEDLFKQLTNEDLKLMGIYEEKERRIPFYPVETNPGGPIKIVFIGLNSYCGNDYPEAYNQPNFTEWCQERYHRNFRRVLNVHIENLKDKLGDFSIYYTNYVKLVLPEGYFKGERAVYELLKKRPYLDSMFGEIIKVEIESLIKKDCKVFITFGNQVSDYLKKLFSLKNNDKLCRFNGDCLFVSEQHYSFRYYNINKTVTLLRKLKEINY